MVATATSAAGAARVNIRVAQGARRLRKRRQQERHRPTGPGDVDRQDGQNVLSYAVLVSAYYYFMRHVGLCLWRFLKKAPRLIENKELFAAEGLGQQGQLVNRFTTGVSFGIDSVDGDVATGDFTQRDNGRLVIFPGDTRLLATGLDLTGT